MPKSVNAVIVSPPIPTMCRQPSSGNMSLESSCNQSSFSPSISATRLMVKTWLIAATVKQPG